MNRHPLITAAVLLAATASTALAAKEQFVRSKPHVNVQACLDELEAVAADGEADIQRVGEHWAGLIEFHLSAGREPVAIGLLLPAVQKVREAAARAQHRLNLTADGCIRALTLSGQLPAVQDVEAARDRLEARLEAAAQTQIDSFFDIWVDIAVDR